MKTLGFKGILHENGWQCPSYVKLDTAGKIVSISASPSPDEEIENIKGYAIPGIVNAHSHAFQYAMAGLNEVSDRSKKVSNFWSWRMSMYRIALAISPEQMEDVAAQLYCQMLKHGYTHVVEFHYLHHDPDGKSYGNPAEMGERLISAAAKTGIHITLVPILYQKGGFGKKPAREQRRFISKSLDDYVSLVDHSKKACLHYSNASLGSGIHSLRAVDADVIKTFLSSGYVNYPFHMHASEQLKEVEESLTYLKKRPVEWLATEIGLNQNFHLVHCTHINQQEIQLLTKSDAHVVLCPSTEGNLGDGFFPLHDFLAHGGSWSLGTDSHIGLNPFEELRILDYGQRNLTHSRISFSGSHSNEPVSGAFNQLMIGGKHAAGIKHPRFFRPGQHLNALVLKSDTPLMESSTPDHLLSTAIYTTGVSDFLGTIVNGKWVIRDAHHFSSDTINSDFRKAMASIRMKA